MNLAKPNPYGNVGIINICVSELNVPVNELAKVYDIFTIFLKQGVILDDTTYADSNGEDRRHIRLSHPLFQYPDETFYNVTCNRELQAITVKPSGTYV